MYVILCIACIILFMLYRSGECCKVSVLSLEPNSCSRLISSLSPTSIVFPELHSVLSCGNLPGIMAQILSDSVGPILSVQPFLLPRLT